MDDIVTLLTVMVIVLFVSYLLGWLDPIIEHLNIRANAKEWCFEQGYTDMEVVNDKPWCVSEGVSPLQAPFTFE